MLPIERAAQLWCLPQFEKRVMDPEFASAIADAIRDAEYDAFVQALRLYAWWKDGVEYVGTCGTTLKQAIDNMESKP